MRLALVTESHNKPNIVFYFLAFRVSKYLFSLCCLAFVAVHLQPSVTRVKHALPTRRALKKCHYSQMRTPNSFRGDSLYPNLSSSPEEDAQIPSSSPLGMRTSIGTLDGTVSTPVPNRFSTNSGNRSRSCEVGSSKSWCAESETPNSRHTSDPDKENQDLRRRSILRRSNSARGPRPSVSFAKQKEVLTFTTEEQQ